MNEIDALADMDTATLERTLANLRTMFLQAQTSLDRIEESAADLADRARRVSADAQAVLSELGIEEFLVLVGRLAAVVSGLGQRRRYEWLREQIELELAGRRGE